MWGTPKGVRAGVFHRRFIPTHVGNTVLHARAIAGHAVHPHACGEHVRGGPGIKQKDGSSPRMWGTQAPTKREPDRYRFIPTHVGNTADGLDGCAPHEVHPHACGEHTRDGRPAVWVAGSSPRMWGTQHHPRLRDPAGRFIPTHVGNTAQAGESRTHAPVHPHACGEHTAALARTALAYGSSPRMWGTLPDVTLGQARDRFIPTHVGNTRRGGARLQHRAVHPHACGEHTGVPIRWIKADGSSPRMWGTRLRIGATTRTSGSSPRMWGTPAHDALQRRRHRFIPTHVGNTGYRWPAGVPMPVHPHACGEHGGLSRSTLHCAGSSPRMWGHAGLGVAAGRGRGSSPRMWGTPVGRSKICDWKSVHPHACGEHLAGNPRSRPADGSSPRMWGTLFYDERPSGIARFIPTHVGNTNWGLVMTWPPTVHPHACGEHCALQFRLLGEVRFIPTHVGNTSIARTAGESPPVHPHACGEHSGALLEVFFFFGSSPRMWGTPVRSFSVIGGQRFIPTHVGNTTYSSTGASMVPVHPHACGEHITDSAAIATTDGSSPRMWGTHDIDVSRITDMRFIPTHVGNTTAGGAQRRGDGVHPHACGEHRAFFP